MQTIFLPYSSYITLDHQHTLAISILLFFPLTISKFSKNPIFNAKKEIQKEKEKKMHSKN